MAYKYKYVEFEQPAGTFLLSVIPAIELLSFYQIIIRRYKETTPDGTQREAEPRVREIAEYVKTLDATFPTSIILAVSEGNYLLDKENMTIEITGKAEVIDGQHRLKGLELSTNIASKFSLPCVFIIEPTDEEKAFVFATINGKQQKVNASLVYDLFGISSTPDPYNILHKLARTLNFKNGSPFYEKLKMLGKKSDDKATESLTQGTFIKTLMPLVSNNPSDDRHLMMIGQYDSLRTASEKEILRNYMIKQKSDLLIPLFENIFNAVKKTWEEEWINHNKYILSKTTGFIGIIKGIVEVIRYGSQIRCLTPAYFEYFFKLVAKEIQTRNLRFTKDDFPSGGVGENKLRDILIDVYENHYPLKPSIIEDLK